MRAKLVAGNWKMHKTCDEVAAFFSEFFPLVEKDRARAGARVDVIFAVPAPFTEQAAKACAAHRARVFAQNVHPEDQGAFTGEISIPMMRSVGAAGTLIGHSERRQFFGDTHEIVAQKMKACLAQGFTPILCVGETKDERVAERTEKVLEQQLLSVLSACPDLKDTIIAYEPVWAIGTGLTATKEQAQEAHAFIRGLLAKKLGQDKAQAISILYGGSVKPENFAELIAQPDIDGGLVGGASLKPKDFASLVTTAANLVTVR